jgi:GAF domain-containing protein/ketosteroid isomerase-like protein
VQHAANLRSLVVRHHQGYNRRDLEALSEVLDADVEMVVDGASIRGAAAALGYATALFRESPRLRIHDMRVVAENADTIVVVAHQNLDGDQSFGPRDLQRSVCEIYRVRDGRIVAYTCYYSAPGGAERGDVAKMAQEQAALRRVATLVARDVSQDELFAAVNAEVGRLVGADPTSLMRFEADDTVTLVAAWGAADAGLPIGARRPVDDALRSLREDGGARWFDPMELPPGAPFVEEARQLAIGSAVGVPIVVDGRVWGAAFAASTRDEPFPKDTTARIAGFTELLATAIANTETRAEVERLVDEQAALRRVATLVARGAAPEQVFAAVAEEIGQLVAVDATYMARDEHDGTATGVAAWSAAGDRIPIGRRVDLEGESVQRSVLRTGQPARIDGYEDASGPAAAAGRDLGLRSSVGVPIVVDERLWGVMIAASKADRAPPADAEARIAAFTEIVATAISNTEARAQVGRLADEQAALRRVATLVARGVAPEDVFEAVTEELGRLLPVDFAVIGRYEADATVIVIAAWGPTTVGFPVGTRWDLEGDNLARLVLETGRPARIDDYADASGQLGGASRESGVRSSVAVPITLEGRVWAGIAVASSAEQPLPGDTETRLMHFAQLVATALSNAHARTDVQRLAEEQAALRRVATLVARGTPPEEVFGAVTEELGRLLLADVAIMCRYEPDATFTVVAGTSAPPVGSRWPLVGRNVTTLVFETGRAVRMDTLSDATGPIADQIQQSGIRSSVGTPVIVDGKLWGVVGVGTTLEQPLPPDTEARLASFTDLVATAIANAEARTEVAASRARIVAATDGERRRVVRDLHDGAQQRLLHTIITLTTGLRALQNQQDDAPALLTEALDHATQANVELRELAHGILPAALTHRGLEAGVEALTSRMPVPVAIDVQIGRLPAAIEATAYFVVAEALTNVAKHARAGRTEVTAQIEHGTLSVQVRDDGVGGARRDGGSGLIGLADRLAALDGELRVDSPPGVGTLVTAAIPFPSSSRVPPSAQVS